MRITRRMRLAAIAVAALVLLGAGVVAASQANVAGIGNLMGSGGDVGGGTGGTSPRPTSIVLDVSGTTGDIHVNSASIGTTVTLTVPQSDPNFKILVDLSRAEQQGNTSAATRTMYLHYTYSDGSTALYTLNNAYESQLSTNMSTGIATATMNPQSVTKS